MFKISGVFFSFGVKANQSMHRVLLSSNNVNNDGHKVSMLWN